MILSCKFKHTISYWIRHVKKETHAMKAETKMNGYKPKSSRDWERNKKCNNKHISIYIDLIAISYF